MLVIPNVSPIRHRQIRNAINMDFSSIYIEKKPVNSKRVLPLILRFLVIALLTSTGGCTVENGVSEVQLVSVKSKVTKWALTRKGSDKTKSLSLNSGAKLVGGGMNLLRWSPDQGILAWIERKLAEDGATLEDSIVLHWQSVSREERVAIRNGRVSSLSWAPDSKSIVLGCTSLDGLPGVPSIVEVVIEEDRTFSVPLDIPKEQQPRNPFYHHVKDQILYVRNSDGLGMYDKNSGAMSVVKESEGNFINGAVLCGSGIAVAEVSLSNPENQFYYWKKQNSGRRKKTLLRVSEVKPLHLYSTTAGSISVYFVAYETEERNSSTILTYDLQRNILESYVDLRSVFGTNQELLAISANDLLDMMAFSLESDDANTRGTWLASKKTMDICRISPIPTDGLSITPDGKYVAYQNEISSISILEIATLESIEN